MDRKSEDDGRLPGERIAKVMARAGLTSRREAEEWIRAGRVAINGSVIASPAVNVTAKDRITVDGAALPARERTRLFLHHKPRGLVTTHADPEGRPTIFAGLPRQLPRLISVGRLDINTEGLLLLTNDGGLARVLELPETGWLRRYRVRAHGRVSQQQLDTLRKGVTLDGIHYGAIDATLEREQGANVWLTFAIREGKNREVRNVLGHLGLSVARLIRVSFGPFQLGELAAGAIEEVKTRHLREQLGDRLAAQAGCDFSAAMTPLAPAISRPAAASASSSTARAQLAPIPRPARVARPKGEGGFPGPKPGKPGGGRGANRKRPPPPGAQERATLPRKRGRDKAASNVSARDERDGGRKGTKGSGDTPAKPRRLRRRYYGKRER